MEEKMKIFFQIENVGKMSVSKFRGGEMKKGKLFIRSNIYVYIKYIYNYKMNFKIKNEVVHAKCSKCKCWRCYRRVPEPFLNDYGRTFKCCH